MSRGWIFPDPPPNFQDQANLSRSGGLAVFALGDNRQRRARADCDFLGQHCLGHFADQIDGQKAIFKTGIGDADIVCQFEAAFEAALGNAHMQHGCSSFRAVLGCAQSGLAALDHQQVLLGGDLKIGGLVAGNGQGDAVGIIAVSFDVERGKVVAAAAGLTPRDAAACSLHHLVGAATTAAVRLMGLDPFEVHALAARLAPRLDQLASVAAELATTCETAELPAANSVLADILAEHHATWEVRLFAS